MDKRALRKQLQQKLIELTESQRNEKSRKACQNLVNTEQFQRSSVVMLFLSLPHEIDTTPAILYTWQREKTVSVPKVSWQQRHMLPVEITSLETGFASESSRLRNPVTGIPTPLEEIDIVVTPGLGYDNTGNRLGRGGAYYDRFFGSERLKAVRCGLAFHEQLVEQIPVDPHDEKLDMLVTDEEILHFNR